MDETAENSEKTLGSSYKLSDKQFQHFVELIYEHTRIKMGDHKRALVTSRLGRRIRALKMDSFDDYIAFLASEEGKTELVNFMNAVTTNKTDFYRENKQFIFLRENLLPEIDKGLRSGEIKKLRIWSAACSTGEEPYTIMLVLLNYFGRSRLEKMDFMMLASDIDTSVLDRAQEGVYREELVKPISQEELKKYFLRGKGEHDGYYKVKDYIKQFIKFRQINLKDETFPIKTEFDILFCRNVIIYFDKEFQRELFAKFYPYLKEKSYVFIGHSETLFGVSERFKYVANNIYRKV